jgi:hypothetical protein
LVLMCFPSLLPKHDVTAFTLERVVPGTDPKQTPYPTLPGLAWRKTSRQLAEVETADLR